MKRLMNYLLGMVRLTITGPFPERLINLCAQHRLDFWAVEWLDEHSVRLTTRRGALKELKELAEKVGCTVEVEKSRGLPAFLARFRTRYAFLVGLVLTLCAVAFLSRFILVIEVSGNEQVPTAVYPKCTKALTPQQEFSLSRPTASPFCYSLAFQLS